MHPQIWIRNYLRSHLRASLLGKLLLNFGKTPARKVHLVCATRKSEADFWQAAALGKSLEAYKLDPRLSISIHYANSAGLGSVYNTHIKSASASDVLLFVHDDVWLDDPIWLPKVLKATQEYDIVGLAGNMRLGPFQPAWLFSAISNGEFIWDTGYLAGSVGHGKHPKGHAMNYGPTPMECKVVDGLFIAVRCSYMRRAKLMFDERFKFHFYDMDFCRSATALGLSIGTWPIDVTHQSVGAFGTSQWREAYQLYLAKWGGG